MALPSALESRHPGLPQAPQRREQGQPQGNQHAGDQEEQHLFQGNLPQVDPQVLALAEVPDARGDGQVVRDRQVGPHHEGRWQHRPQHRPRALAVVPEQHPQLEGDDGQRPPQQVNEVGPAPLPSAR
ncbi:proline-rich proteoglycan 2, partial [Stigmatella aurantiaca DW4/3-1]